MNARHTTTAARDWEDADIGNWDQTAVYDVQGPVAIPSSTLGSDVYSFSYPAASGAARLYDYTTNATVIYIKIRKN